MIQFAFDKSGINGGDKQTLSPVITWLKDDAERNVAVHGYTDSVGADAYNLKLSEKRAQAVRDYFVQNGVRAERVTARGMGEASPIAPNDTEAGREKNRRVEVISNGGTRTASTAKPQ
jgi:OOP family OmpA-OmpF porin